MSERLRIDAADIAKAPEVEQSAGRPRDEADSISGGDVFGHVEKTGELGESVSRGIWAMPKLLLTLAGLTAAICASILVDGLLGFGRYEAAGREVPVIVSLLFMSSYCALVTSCIAAVDDLACGAFLRAAIFGGVGFVFGFIGGVVGNVIAGLVFMLLAEVAQAIVGEPDSAGKMLVFAMASRVPAWLIAGLLTGAIIGAMGRSLRRARLGAVGGAIGGLVGGILFDPLGYLLGGFGPGSSAILSRFIGLVCMGGATGFTIAFAEQAAKQAWLAVERGRLIGKQFILYRNPTRIGASYSNDVFLFKDTSVRPEHALISRRGGSFIIEATQGALVRVNGQPTVSRQLNSGDSVQIGETLMRFNAKA